MAIGIHKLTCVGGNSDETRLYLLYLFAVGHMLNMRIET